MDPQAYVTIPSSFGEVGLLWEEIESGAAVVQSIFLPNERDLLDATISKPDVVARSCPAIDTLRQKIAAFLSGEAVDFDLDILNLDRCSDFQRRVLLAEAGIPRGRVSTYGRIAAYLGVPQGARAVGGALARNPFPLVIPCHRAVRSDGGLGGYRGGLVMKRALLEMEGVEITAEGKVLTDEFYYER